MLLHQETKPNGLNMREPIQKKSFIHVEVPLKLNGAESSTHTEELKTAQESLMYQKNIRIKNRPLINYIQKELFCIVCTKQPVDAHHVKSKKSGGHDVVHNLMPLCREHHTELHKVGLNEMADKYQGILIWLQSAEWQWDEFKQKWIYL